MTSWDKFFKYNLNLKLKFKVCLKIRRFDCLSLTSNVFSFYGLQCLQFTDHSLQFRLTLKFKVV
jgi:hypothetical protein